MCSKKSEKVYLRDKRSPKPKDEKTSRTMSAIGSRDTRPELLLRKALRLNGMGGYRLHRRDLPGKPDIAFIGKRIAIFVHGCYWHRCPNCQLSLPKTNSAFWQRKFEANISRDKKKAQELEQMGWKVLVIWECQIKQDMVKCLSIIKKSYEEET